MKKKPMSNLLTRASNYLSNEKFEDAINGYLTILEKQPQNIKALVGHGDACFGFGDYYEAEKSYRKALKSDPNNSDVLFGLAATLRVTESYEDSAKIYQRAFKSEPSRWEAYWELAYSLEMAGDLVGAEKAYQRCLRAHPNHCMAEHLLSALVGSNTKRAPAAYIRDLFDDYASSFEDELIESLNYQSPNQIRELLQKQKLALSQENLFNLGLDLGCGTGLVGEALLGLVRVLDGVDLSEKMLELTNAKRCYRNTFLSDFEDFLFEKTPNFEDYDLVVSSDSLVYFGELEKIFLGVFHRLVLGGLFCFTLENTDKRSFVLQRSGRYAHSKKYIFKLASKIGFVGFKSHKITPRNEGDVAINGRLYLMFKPES